MKLWLGLQVGLKEVWAHKFRSFLTMLGIILGVASLIAMYALVAGMAKGMREMLESTGGVERVRLVTKEVSEENQSIAFLSPGITMMDAEAIAKGAPLVDLIAPEIRLQAAITYGGNTFRQSVSGSLPDYFEMSKLAIEYGRALSHLDVEKASRVVVLGSAAVAALWPDKPGHNPIGETVLINERPFRVIGTMPLFESEEARKKRELGVTAAEEQRRAQRGRATGRGRGSRWDPYFYKNNAVIIPVTTMFYEFKSAAKDGEPSYQLDVLTFRISDVSRFDEAIEQVRTTLMRTHRGVDDFGFDTREDWFDSIESSVKAAQASGGLIAGISLLVGGIGIANIMLASITERIREIGVRRAVGATGRDIFVQIVVESTVIGLIGGLLGLVASFGVIHLLKVLSPMQNAPIVEVSSVLVSLGFAVAVGIISGLYPAWRAATLDPIEALRYG